MVDSAGVFEETLVNLVFPYGFLNNEWPRGRKGTLEVEVKTSMLYFTNFDCSWSSFLGHNGKGLRRKWCFRSLPRWH